MTTQARLKAVRRLAHKCGWNLRALRADSRYVCHLDRGGGTTGEPYERITGTNRRGKEPPLHPEPGRGRVAVLGDAPRIRAA